MKPNTLLATFDANIGTTAIATSFITSAIEPQKDDSFLLPYSPL